MAKTKPDIEVVQTGKDPDDPESYTVREKPKGGK